MRTFGNQKHYIFYIKEQKIDLYIGRIELLIGNYHFIREELQAGGIDIRGSTTKKYAVDIRVRDEHSLMKAALNSLDGIDIIYTVEISPPLSRNSVFVLPIDPLEELLDGNYFIT